MCTRFPLYVVLLMCPCEDEAQLQIRLFSFIIHLQLFKINDQPRVRGQDFPAAACPVLSRVLHLDPAMVSAQPIHGSAAYGQKGRHP